MVQDRSGVRVLLVNPPDASPTDFDPWVASRGRYSNYPPYGLGIVSSRVRERGHSVKMLNLNHIALSEGYGMVPFRLKESIEDFRPDVVGVTCVCSMTSISALTTCGYIKKHHDAFVVMGGPWVTNTIRSGGDIPFTDAVFLGESEDMFCDWLEGKITGTVIEGGRPSDIDVIPDHEGMRTSELSSVGMVGSYMALVKGKKIGTVLSNRGCRGNCKFCTVRSLYGAGVRHRSIENILKELKLLKNLGIGHWMWIDDDLFYDHNRAIRLFNAIADANLRMTWDAGNGVVAGSCKRDVIQAAANSGCIGLHVGVESGSPEILLASRKPATVRQYREAALVLADFPQISTRGFLMIGFPGETYRQMMDTMELALDMNFDWWNVNILQHLPNTEYEEENHSTRLSTGPYARRVKTNTQNPFSDADMDSVPPPEALPDICGYISYKVNYDRLNYLRNQMKAQQIAKYIDYICEVVAPDDPVPLQYAKMLRGDRSVDIRTH